jgi:hypothetical protein
VRAARSFTSDSSSGLLLITAMRMRQSLNCIEAKICVGKHENLRQQEQRTC